MLFSIVTIILAVYCVISPVIIISAVKFGMKCADNPQEVTEKPFINVPKRKKNAKVSPEWQRGIDIMANIDAYDGTDVGQKEIKDV